MNQNHDTHVKRVCTKHNHYSKVIKNLVGKSKSSTGYSRCASCALEAGMLQAALGLPKASAELALKYLPESHSGLNKERDALEAYHLGYDSYTNPEDFNIVS
ncbi:hypothetical protein OGI38_003757 [Salmonella enterica]|uniref:hypothetical protein n=1 Tax=Salmonella enterica TaxID=28901 RepID=UPI001D5E64E1|nr:hypothetical protein [Salmonella enterica subsp. enterica serovar Java]EHN2924183.1 hypothetical protein [Salmonella enterica]EHX9662133.1 hypothetical protein [Salmonella enterica]EID5175575.1 hypothetical protein [Salmonella enterica]EIG9284148.1 hypothetical protein [Salmonella enterica]